MNPLVRSCFLAAAACALATARASGPADPSAIGLLPTNKISTPVDAGERNPFSRVEQKQDVALVEDAESEESKIRAVFARLAVTGAIRGNAMRKALLGPFIVRPGARLPPVIEGQTEALICTSITDTSIEISFIERSDLVDPRKILIPYNLSPYVAVLTGVEDPAQSSKPAAATNSIRATPLKSAVEADVPPET